ncbi:GNAT family N-acetyltransferase [Mongoliimonas terrestris]|uniref:GNAT family N-acetyltransferase n=1 Tax=Mongoliimonas terrestris TaxID=1709001 RepID=UPI000949858F|nr:GNAT family protein [Mongoliimonas terrestris]
MSHDSSPFGDPIGLPLPGWTPRPRPPRTPMLGRTCAVVPLSAKEHGADLFAAQALDGEGRMWTYMPNGPWTSEADYLAWARSAEASEDPQFFAVVDADSGKPLGTCSYLRIDPANGAIEVGWIAWSPILQQTPAATEAMYLMMARVFDELGYRRYEWKCNALNAPSRRAAERLGFTYEGLFRQAAVVKGRNRDTAWYAILDHEWPRAKAAFQAWLDPDNFDEDTLQKRSLAEIRAGL